MNLKYILMIMSIFIFVACAKSNTENPTSINIESREIFDEDNRATKIHIDPFASEYINIDYRGEKRYQLDIEIWSKGEVISQETKLLDIELKKYYGISMEVDERDSETFNVVIGMYEKDSVFGSDFDITVDKNDSKLNGRVESKHIEPKVFNDGEDILLWGLHRFDNGFDVFEDGYEAASNMEWSILFILKPYE